MPFAIQLGRPGKTHVLHQIANTAHKFSLTKSLIGVFLSFSNHLIRNEVQ